MANNPAPNNIFNVVSNLYGRRKILTDVAEINEDNFIDVLNRAIKVHDRNFVQENYLWKYYKGRTPILNKSKEYRDAVNNIINENRAMQVVEFYQGYIFGEPVQYVRRDSDDTYGDEIKWLNDLMARKDKISQDDELSEYMLVMGVCPKIVLPSKVKEDVFDSYVLDPRSAGVIYHNSLGEPAVMCFKITVKEDGAKTYACYTKDHYYETDGNAILRSEKHTIGCVPMVEYCLNNVRMGSFEAVISILNAIDNLQSSRLDDVQQFVDSILCILGGEISEDIMSKLSEWKALSLPEGVDAKYLTSSLQQSDIQTLKDDLMSAVIEILGMPNRNGGSSTSDTGAAVILRDGWQTTEAKSKRIENQYKKADKQVLDIILSYASTFNVAKLERSAIDIKFTRRNYENIQTKATVLTEMLNNSKIHPRLAFVHCGMFSDPEQAYLESLKYWEEENAKQNTVVGTAEANTGTGEETGTQSRTEEEE